MKLLTGVVTVAALLGLSVERPGVAPPAGSITGTVVLEPPPPPRRTANRYRTAGSQATRAEQEIAPIVYLRGEIPGSATTGTVEVLQQDTMFVPSSVVVEVGTTVSFPNGDDFFHNVFSYSEARTFDLGRYPRGESKSVTFDQVGVVEVFCEVHDFMRGIVLVAENPYHSVVAEDGSFSIDGVPAGTYTLVAWHPDRDMVEQSVTVTDGGTVRIEVELPS